MHRERAVGSLIRFAEAREDRWRDFGDWFPPLSEPMIGQTPNCFALVVHFPNGPYLDPAVYTWDQVIERAWRVMVDAHDPVRGVEVVALEPL